ncbi:uncharacterized protein LOC105261982 [Musca domestica]|uniref:Uncharacterized protein LOC105261982 n=1 Tax=Musca domestica TaxID=7370 RepID=A0A9J7D6T1_MUSDO|nr:uncharacterized protein LOC105261982 [Musca domestica]
MDSKDFQKDLLPLNESKSEWFLVQYDQDAQKLTRKIVNSDDLMWNEELLKVESDNDGQKKKEHVLIRDQNKLHLGHIIYRAKTLEECIDHHTYLQIICMQLLHTPHEVNDIMDRLHFNNNFWLLVMYSRSPKKEEQVVYAVFHRNDVIMKVDSHTNALMAFVQEGPATFKGMVVKISNDLSDMMFVIDIIRNELLKSCEENATTKPHYKRQEFKEKIAILDFRMHCESQLLIKAIQAVDRSKTRMEYRYMYLQHLYNMSQQQQLQQEQQQQLQQPQQ